MKRRKGDDEAVKCPYLGTGKKGCACNASVTRIAPSRYELNRYCTTEAFYLCPILLARLLRGGDQKNTRFLEAGCETSVSIFKKGE